jgi:hypothetical protein
MDQLQLDGPTQLLEFVLDGGEGELEGAAAVGAGGALGENAFALHLEGLEAALAVGLGAFCLDRHLGGGRSWGRRIGLLLFNTLGFPAFSHGFILLSAFRLCPTIQATGGRNDR